MKLSNFSISSASTCSLKKRWSGLSNLFESDVHYINPEPPVEIFQPLRLFHQVCNSSNVFYFFWLAHSLLGSLTIPFGLPNRINLAICCCSCISLLFQINIKGPSTKSHHSFFKSAICFFGKTWFQIFRVALFYIHYPLAIKVTFCILRICLVAFKCTVFFCVLKDRT